MPTKKQLKAVRKRISDDMEMEVVSQCYNCKNYISNSKCIAFPKGIPDQIVLNEWDHTEKFTGDNGVTFKQI